VDCVTNSFSAAFTKLPAATTDKKVRASSVSIYEARAWSGGDSTVRTTKSTRENRRATARTHECVIGAVVEMHRIHRCVARPFVQLARSIALSALIRFGYTGMPLYTFTHCLTENSMARHSPAKTRIHVGSSSGRHSAFHSH